MSITPYQQLITDGTTSIAAALAQQFPNSAGDPDQKQNQQLQAAAIMQGLIPVLIPFLLKNLQIIVQPGQTVSTGGTTTTPGTGIAQ